LKNWSKWIIILVTSVILLIACSSTGSENVGEQESSSEQTGTITIVVSESEADEVFSEDEIEIADGDILMDVMKDNYDIDEDEGFINGIDGIFPEEDEEKSWIYSVNDEDALVGAHEYELSIDDEVVFDLQTWE